MSNPFGIVESGHTPPPEDRTRMDRAMLPLRKTLRWLGLALLTTMIALPVLQVGLREFTRLSFIGAGELTRFMLICVVFITLPYVVSSGANIRMEEMAALLPIRVQRFLKGLVAATAVLAFTFAAYSVGLATYRNLNNATPTLGIPYWVFFSAAFVGLLLAAVESVIQFAKQWRGREPYVTFTEEQPPEDLPEV
jgi:TRAP-type C4-dicarboxylate transport system permease small subunit